MNLMCKAPKLPNDSSQWFSRYYLHLSTGKPHHRTIFFSVGTCLPIARIRVGSLRSRLRLLLGVLRSEARTMGSYHSQRDWMMGRWWEVQMQVQILFNYLFDIYLYDIYLYDFIFRENDGWKFICAMKKPFFRQLFFKTYPWRWKNHCVLQSVSSRLCKVDLEDFRKSGQWGHILTSSDGIKGGLFFFEVGCKLMGIHIDPTGLVQSHRKWCDDDELQ